jgi:hypothetical protein
MSPALVSSSMRPCTTLRTLTPKQGSTWRLPALLTPFEPISHPYMLEMYPMPCCPVAAHPHIAPVDGTDTPPSSPAARLLPTPQVRQAAARTNDTAGDGTTTATIMSAAFIAEGLKIVAAGGAQGWGQQVYGCVCGGGGEKQD